jgi:diguanylate cyclase (GGDEF)-like protein
VPRPAQILVVDDVADNRAILARPFSRRGFNVIEAEDGQTALDLLASREIDIALLDISMPGMDGLDLLRRIRATQPARLPIIMVTARTHTDDAMIAFNLGADDYVTKPVDLPVLIARVETQLARAMAEQQLQQAVRKISDLNFEMHLECARRAEAEALALDRAHHDPLTGLCNRLRFRELLSAELQDLSETANRLALLLIDLDGFKQVNDTHGHAAGDELLTAVAHRLRGCVHETHTIARLGGDEFAVLVPAIDPDDATALASRIVEVISMPFNLSQEKVGIGCSVGITFARRSQVHPDLLYREADSALYAAKREGRGRWRVTSHR